MPTPPTNIEITASDKTQAAFRSATDNLGKLNSASAKLNAVLVGLPLLAIPALFVNMTKSSIDAADNLNDLAKKSGIAVDNLAGLQLVVDKSGTTMEMLAGGVSKLNKTLGEASLGGKEQQQVLRDLGITASDPMEAFYQLADAFGNFKDEGQKAAAMSKVIGKSWTELAPALSEGGAGLRAMVEEGKKHNPITQEMAERADKFNDALARLKTQASGVGTSIANDMLPAMNAFLEAWNDAITLAQRHGAFYDLMFSPTSFTPTAQLKDVRNEITAINLQLKDAGTAQGDIAGINGEKLRARLGELTAIKTSLEEIQQREALAANDKFKTGDYKTAKAPGLPKIELSGMNEAIKKAFDLAPMDAFIDKFGANRIKIIAELDKLKAGLDGANKLPDEVQGIDVQNQIALAREKLVRGDATGAQAGIERGRELLKKAAEQGEGFLVTGYLADQLKGLDLQKNDMSLEAAKATRDNLAVNFTAQQEAALSLKVNPDDAKKKAQEILKFVQDELNANPLNVVFQPVNAAHASDVSWSNDLAREATKRGAR